MGTRNRTYPECISQVRAVTGNDLGGDDKTRVDSLLNLAASRAKRSTDYWERWLVVDEPRAVSRGFVDPDEDSFHIYGGGTAASNGLYERNGVSSDGNPAYTFYDSDGTTALYNLWSSSNATWFITSSAIDDTPVTIYFITSSATTPPLTGWSLSSGTTPAPLLKATGTIEAALYWTRNADSHTSFRTYEFSSDTYGLRPWGNTADNGVVYVTYIKPDTSIYGDGTGGTTTVIPEEWFDYMSLYASYMLQVSQRQGNPNAAYGIALREVDKSLIDQHMRLETQGTPRLVIDNVQSRIAYQNIL